MPQNSLDLKIQLGIHLLKGGEEFGSIRNAALKIFTEFIGIIGGNA